MLNLSPLNFSSHPRHIFLEIKKLVLNAEKEIPVCAPFFGGVKAVMPYYRMALFTSLPIVFELKRKKGFRSPPPLAQSEQKLSGWKSIE